VFTDQLPRNGLHNTVAYSLYCIATAVHATVYKTTISPFVSYGPNGAHDYFSLATRAGNRFKLFEDKVLRRLFKPKKKNVKNGREETAEEIHNLHIS
jgi:hypothetical protein